MTITAEALKAQVREDEEIAAAVAKAMEAAKAGREKPLAQYLAGQRLKRGLPDSWPSANLTATEAGVVVAEW